MENLSSKQGNLEQVATPTVEESTATSSVDAILQQHQVAHVKGSLYEEESGWGVRYDQPLVYGPSGSQFLTNYYNPACHKSQVRSGTGQSISEYRMQNNLAYSCGTMYHHLNPAKHCHSGVFPNHPAPYNGYYNPLYSPTPAGQYYAPLRYPPTAQYAPRYGSQNCNNQVKFSKNPPTQVNIEEDSMDRILSNGYFQKGYFHYTGQASQFDYRGTIYYNVEEQIRDFQGRFQNHKQEIKKSSLSRHNSITTTNVYSKTQKESAENWIIERRHTDPNETQNTLTETDDANDTRDIAACSTISFNYAVDGPLSTLTLTEGIATAGTGIKDIIKQHTERQTPDCAECKKSLAVVPYTNSFVDCLQTYWKRRQESLKIIRAFLFFVASRMRIKHDCLQVVRKVDSISLCLERSEIIRKAYNVIATILKSQALNRTKALLYGKYGRKIDKNMYKETTDIRLSAEKLYHDHWHYSKRPIKLNQVAYINIDMKFVTKINTKRKNKSPGTSTRREIVLYKKEAEKCLKAEPSGGCADTVNHVVGSTAETHKENYGHTGRFDCAEYKEVVNTEIGMPQNGVELDPENCTENDNDNYFIAMFQFH